ncbi:MAG: hypothetical protein Hyperionvirus7_71 [Hyperionvirus sp.]|uniref:Uncharacterized protein n=1 Tax=Hyperionvirus sp. TaxID=2487770 RepID=A0A3G5A883_9VIRU|nr:MAG: hypothetical protein Hyperionvirus7_71 [Hyperionvirus sp.]
MDHFIICSCEFDGKRTPRGKKLLYMTYIIILFKNYVFEK